MTRHSPIDAIATLLVALLATLAPAQPAPEAEPGVVFDLRPLVWPALGQRAAAAPLPPPGLDRYQPPRDTEFLRPEPAPGLLLRGQRPSEIVRGLPRRAPLDRAFTLELWLLDHVNQPVGVLARLNGVIMTDDGDIPIDGALTYWGGRVRFEGTGEVVRGVAFERDTRGWKGYWRHVVVTYDGSALSLYVNGAYTDEQFFGEAQVAWADLEVAAYTANEPYMRLGDILKLARLYNRPLAAAEVSARFESLSRDADAGFIVDDFHFNAGPALSAVGPTGAAIVWETDRPADAVIRYGRTARLELGELTITRDDRSAPGERSSPDRPAISHARIEGLRPGTPYFYELSASDETGRTIRSGVLTFKTATGPGNPVRFALIGDTEARPHINRRIAELVWDERPDFIVNVGDLTDGGRRPRKFEWNLEYFQGGGALYARVPVFPVAGNGEGDLHWYSRYHADPIGGDASRGYYTFTWGDVQFFMLDSNRSADGFKPGGEQHEWLDAALAESRANPAVRWRIAAHHHAPYSSDEDDYGNSWQGESDLGDRNVRQIVPLYERHGVDLVLYGHLHTAERSLPIRDGAVVTEGAGGVVYIQAGGAGGNLEDFAPTRSFFSGKTYRGHHYATVSVNGDALEFRMHDLDGDLRDIFTMKKD